LTHSHIAESVAAMMDARKSLADILWDMAKLNPLGIPWTMAWDVLSRMPADMMLSLSAQTISGQIKRALKDPWPPSIEPVRRRILDIVDKSSAWHDWQESTLRRTVEAHTLEFSPGDAARMRDLGLKLDLVIAHDDQVIPWPVQRGLAGADLIC
jgi:hypothetical protein